MQIAKVLRAYLLLDIRYSSLKYAFPKTILLGFIYPFQLHLLIYDIIN